MSSNSKRGTSGSSAESDVQSTCKRSLTSQSCLASEAEKALRILKNTFCTQETCAALSLKNLNEGQSECIKSTCSGGSCSLGNDITRAEICTKKKRVYCKRQNGACIPSRVYPVRGAPLCRRKAIVKRSECQVPVTERTNDFKVIPAYACSDSDS